MNNTSTQKLKRYRLTNKGIVKGINLNSGPNLKMAATVPVLVIASYSSLMAQCSNSIIPAATPVIVPQNGGVGGGVAFDVNSADGPGNDFSIFEQPGNSAVKLNILNPDFSVLRVATHTDNSASALNTNGVVSTGGDFVNSGNSPLFLNYSINGSNGQFSDGTNGFVVFKNSAGHLGFFQLHYEWEPVNDNHLISINSGGISNQTGNITAGNCNTLILPVELVSFYAKERDGVVKLHWITASETDNAGFEIQRSEDGERFSSIGFVEGNGTTSDHQEYSFDDKDSRRGQLYYYRLKQIDFGGQFEHSKILSVTLSGGASNIGEFYPNPSVTGQVSVDFITQDEGEWNISLFNSMGKLIFSENQFIPQGNSLQNFSLINYPNGVYIFKVENGEEQFYRKVIINK